MGGLMKAAPWTKQGILVQGSRGFSLLKVCWIIEIPNNKSQKTNK
jgi:hypothetical protein